MLCLATVATKKLSSFTYKFHDYQDYISCILNVSFSVKLVPRTPKSVVQFAVTCQLQFKAFLTVKVTSVTQ